jgi:hypothetical protein
MLYRNNATAVELDKPMPGQVDIPRLRAGRVGAFFWCVGFPSGTPSVLSLIRSLAGRRLCHALTTLARIPAKTFFSPFRLCGTSLPDSHDSGAALHIRNELTVFRDTLEQIDISHQLIRKYSDVCSTSSFSAWYLSCYGRTTDV